MTLDDLWLILAFVWWSVVCIALGYGLGIRGAR